MIKEWYDNAWATGRKLSRKIPDYIQYVNKLPIKETETFLDIGCGDGKLCNLAGRATHLVTGIDISEVAIAKAKENCTYGTFEACCLEDFKSNTVYDYITAIGSLEHMPDIKGALKIMHMLGRLSTTYVIVVPNSDFLLWKLTGKPGTHQQEIGETLHSLEEWSQIIKDSGFNIKSVDYDRGPSKLKFVLPFIALKYTYQFVFFLTKNQQ
jgi:cyclopropane fatty-acyl-phospholipid synthase-like methyltransferase